jgi:hypothetical protein
MLPDDIRQGRNRAVLLNDQVPGGLNAQARFASYSPGETPLPSFGGDMPIAKSNMHTTQTKAPKDQIPRKPEANQESGLQQPNATPSPFSDHSL